MAATDINDQNTCMQILISMRFINVKLKSAYEQMHFI